MSFRNQEIVVNSFYNFSDIRLHVLRHQISHVAEHCRGCCHVPLDDWILKDFPADRTEAEGPPDGPPHIGSSVDPIGGGVNEHQ